MLSSIVGFAMKSPHSERFSASVCFLLGPTSCHNPLSDNPEESQLGTRVWYSVRRGVGGGGVQQVREGCSRWGRGAAGGLHCLGLSAVLFWACGMQVRRGGGGVGHSLWDSKQGRSPEEGTCEM